MCTASGTFYDAIGKSEITYGSLFLTHTVHLQDKNHKKNLINVNRHYT